MPGIFSRFGFLAMLLLLAACGGRESETIAPPKDVAATVEPFLAAVRKGQKAEAKKYVVAAASDELDAQFGADHVRLAHGPDLKPRLIEKRAAPAFGADFEMVTVNYAGRQNGSWTSATVRAV